MSLIYIPERKIRANFKPDFPVEIDWNNPDTRGLIVLVNNGVDMLSGVMLSPINGATPTIGKLGRESQINASNSAYKAASPVTPSTASILWFGEFLSAPSTDASLGGITNNNTNAAPYVAVEIKRQNLTANSVYLTWADTATTFKIIETPGISATGIHTLIGSVSSSAQNFLVDGVNYSAAIATTISYGTGPILEVGDSLNARNPAAACSILAIWNRPLSSSAMARINKNPLALLRPKQRSLYLAVSGGTSLTLDSIFMSNWFASLQNDKALNAEFSAQAQKDSSLNPAWESAVQKDHAIHAEWTAQINADKLIVTEFSALRQADASAAIEMLAGAQRNTSAPIDHLSAQQADTAAPTEWSGAILVSTDAQLPLEWYTHLTQDATLAADWKIQLQQDGTVPADWSATIQRDHQIPLTNTAVFATTSTVNLEYAQAFVDEHKIASDWLMLVQVSGNAAVEWGSITRLSIDTVIPVEWGGASAFMTGITHIFRIDARGTVFKVSPRSTIFKPTQH